MQSYTVEKNVGSGGYAYVHEVHDPLHPERLLVCKILRKKKAETALNDLHFEYSLLRAIAERSTKDLPSPVPHVYDFVFEPCPSIIMERMQTDLFRMITDAKIFQTTAVLMKYSEEIVRAILFLHTMGIVHCDVKPCNIMLSHSGALKLIDFGLSQWSSDDAVCFHPKGTRGFLSPETHSPQGYHCKPQDMWAVGTTLVTMATGRRPYRETLSSDPWFLGDKVASEKGCFNPVWDRMRQFNTCTDAEMPEQWLETMRGCLIIDPRCRMSAQEAVERIQKKMPDTATPPRCSTA